MRYIKIPRFAAAKIITRNEVGLFCVYASLKSLYGNSAINGWHKRLKELAKHTGMCQRSVKDYIKKIISEGLATNDKGILRLRKFTDLAKRYDLTVFNNGELQHSIFRITKVKDIKLELRRQVILDMQMEQHLASEYKVKHASRYLSKAKISRDSATRRSDNRRSYSKVLVGCITTQAGIAGVMGRKYHSTGKYWSDKLEDRKMIVVRRNAPVLAIRKGNSKMLQALRESLPGYTFFIGDNGSIWRRVPNDIRVRGRGR